MGNKVITIRLPPWLSEDKAMEVINEVITRLGGRVTADEVRKSLGIKPEELIEDLETEDYRVEELRERERKRLP